MSAHTVQWVTASPLWPGIVQPGSTNVGDPKMRRPALLRFASDSFMDDLAGVLDAEPARVAQLEAQPESFRLAPPGEEDGWEPTLDRLKLYQPAHGHFYLVAATLACRVPGLPEHPADPARGETVSFVLRRVEEDGEWAWTGDPATGARGWTLVPGGDERSVVPGEDLLPLFPVNYEHRDRRRRLYVGLVPTSSRETFTAAGPLSPLPETPPTDLPDARLDALDGRVLRAMRELPHDPGPTTPLSGSELVDAIEAVAEQRLEMSRLALLELIGLMRNTIPALFEAIAEGGPRPSGGAGTMYDTLGARRVGPSGSATWRAALATAWSERMSLSGEDDEEMTLYADLLYSTLSPGELQSLYTNALPARESPEGKAGEAAAQPPRPPEVPKLDARGDALYRLRCVYRRPECGPLTPDVVSEPTESFTIAPFFDMDAPARDVMVSLPVDTSLRDLRRFRKGVSFLISDELRKQMSRATSLKDAMEGNVSSGQQFNLGVICAFSIPIITIVALILLLLIVSLLNFVFGWLPYLRICFPMLLGRR